MHVCYRPITVNLLPKKFSDPTVVDPDLKKLNPGILMSPDDPRSLHIMPDDTEELYLSTSVDDLFAANPFYQTGTLRLEALDITSATGLEDIDSYPQSDRIEFWTDEDPAAKVQHLEWSGAELADYPDTCYIRASSTFTNSSLGILLRLKYTADNGDTEVADLCRIHPVIVDMVPDYNRDGKIEAQDRGQVTISNPWRWWVNNDLDFGDASGDDIPKIGEPYRNITEEFAHGHMFVDGMRDLVDFFPLHLDLQKVLASLPPEEFQYFISHHEDGFGFIEFLQGIPDGTGSLSSHPNSHFTHVYGGKDLAEAAVRRITAAGVQLSETYLNQAAKGKGFLLVEALKETEIPIELLIRKDGELVAIYAFPTKISHVEKMYRHVDLTQIPTNYDGSSPGKAPSSLPTQTGDPGDPYPDELSNGKYFVFVHGFRISPEDARGWHAEIFKRMHQLGSKARFVGVTWNGDTGLPGILPDVTTLDYHKAVFFAFQTGDALKDALSFTAGADVTIAAHSLGNMVVSHAIQEKDFAPDRYYLINGAVAREAYDDISVLPEERMSMTERDWRPYLDIGQSRLFASHWHNLFSGDPIDNRNKLRWKNRFLKVVTNFREAHNFYSTGDEVVQNPELDSASAAATVFNLIINPPFDPGRGTWVAQEFVKGGTSQILQHIQSRNQGGWVFNNNHRASSTLHQGYWIEDGILNSVYRLYTPEEAQDGILDEQLRQIPFFKPFRESNLFEPALGSAMASLPKVQYDVLARGIPAQSYSIAANPHPAFRANYNMSGMFRNSTSDWPEEGHSGFSEDKWLHNDFKNVAFNYLHKMYQKMVDLGELDQ